MGNGTPIYGIGIVQCIFHTRDTNLIIHDHCYHVPNAHTGLLIPQQLLSTRGGAIGTFTIGDKSAPPPLDGKLSIQIPYNSKSYIIVALDRNATPTASPTEFNISVLFN